MPYDLKNGLLPFPLNFLASEGGIDTTPFVEGDKSLITSGVNWYVLCLDPDDFTDLLSVVGVGAPIALPDTYGKLIQQINQLAQYPNQIPESSCMDLCQLIFDCIDDTPALQQVIAQFSLASPISQTAPEVQANLDIELVNDPVSCDLDIIFGMTTGYTDLMNTISEDILQIFANATSPAGRIGDIIEAIPVIGEAPLDDIFQFVESFMTDLNDAYDAAYTSQIRDDIRCDLFCLAKNNSCVLTLEMARDYFYDKLAESITLTVWDGFLDDIIGIAYSGENSIWALHLLITQTIIFGGELIGFDVNRLLATIQSLYNDPDSDHSTVCDACDWTSTLDLTISDYGFVFEEDDFEDPTGEWEDGVGLKGTCIDVSGAIQILLQGHWDFDLSDVKSWETFGTYTRGSFTSGSHTALAFVMQEADVSYSPSLLLKTFTQMGSGTSPLDFTDNFTADPIDEFSIYCRSSRATCDGVVTLTKVIITGEGIKPSQLP